jgi:hydrogenase expression/formation protein HypD
VPAQAKLREATVAAGLLAEIRGTARRVQEKDGRRPVLMEVCGTHTMALGKSGIRGLLADCVDLVSGPGCPVCVTAPEDIDAAITLATLPGVIVATFGDMVRVLGSFSSLEQERARGAAVHVVYSPLQAVELAQTHPDREVVFLGIGFETTAPVVALSLLEAEERRIRNYSLLSLHKLIFPALAALLADPAVRIDGLLLPGHVCAVTGWRVFSPVAQEYGLPAVVTGFEVLDLLGGILILLRLLERGQAQVVNGYFGVVRELGNPRAKVVLQRAFRTGAAVWRGLGMILDSGLQLRPEFAQRDAAQRFSLQSSRSVMPVGCRCGDVLRGKIRPIQCALFGRECKPSSPVGPCMVSAEGACAAHYFYGSS